MTKIKTSTSIAAGFIGGVAFLVGCGGGSTSSAVAAATELWSNVGTTIFYTDGNVGIGTDTPENILHVKDTSSGNVKVLFETGTDDDVNIDLKNDAQYWRIMLDASLTASSLTGPDDSLHIYHATSTGHVTTFTPSGNVGIGTTNPISKFAVNGLPTSAPDASGNAGVVCVTADGNFWLDNDGTADCT
jgi:hypothetical protein